MAQSRSRGTLVVTEAFRMAVVLGLTAVGFTFGDEIAAAAGVDDVEAVRLLASVLGALVGYILGGVIGRLGVRRVDLAQERLEAIEAPVLVAALLGGTLAGLATAVVLSPILLLPGRAITVPFALAVLLLLVYAGVRIGATRGGDLARYLGVRGRVEVRSPSRGAGTRLLDSSALIDGRLVDVARCGFLDGTLVVPQFVLEEVQGLADAQEHPQARPGRPRPGHAADPAGGRPRGGRGHRRGPTRRRHRRRQARVDLPRGGARRW